MFELGRLCMKIAGRDAGKKAVIVEVHEDHFVTIDGETRRRKVNIKHLEPLNKVLKIKKGASRADVKKEFSELGIELKDTKPKKAAERPKKAKVVKNKQEDNSKVKVKSDKNKTAKN